MIIMKKFWTTISVHWNLHRDANLNVEISRSYICRCGMDRYRKCGHDCKNLVNVNPPWNWTSSRWLKTAAVETPTTLSNTPKSVQHQEVAVHIVFLEGAPVIQIVEKCTTWSETSILTRLSLEEQIAAFQRIPVLRHAPPTVVYGDNENKKDPSRIYCQGLV